ncbi:Fe-S cluster assembly protein SufD [Thermoplasmatales archaeon SW_10_69_26]|nr:MAG: Fe-S cluster assembly protein SufD [Thermoplasmatales archaeon SW_10_69_26]
MTQTQPQLDVHLANRREIEGQLPGSTDWVSDLRRRGLETYEEEGWPTQDEEAWKYTSLQAARETEYASPLTLDEADVSREDLAEFTFDATTAQLVFVNGRYRADLSNLDAVPEAATVRPLADVLDEDPGRVRGLLGEYAEPEDEPLTGLNTANFADGAYVEVPETEVVEAPIHVLYLTTDVGEPIAVHPRTLIVAHESSQVPVVETYAGLDDVEAFTNAVTEVFTAKNATVDHVKLNRESPETIHVGTQEFEQDRDSVVRSNTVTFGSKLTRNNVYDMLVGEGIDANLNGLYMGTDDQHIDNYTRIRHDEPHGDSHQLYKGILDDSSRGVFRGTIFVSPGAQKTDGYQHNPNMIVSEDALANSVPQLEIFADDVKCSHGSTTGDVDDKWIFYLRSRGLSEDQARDLIVYSFAGEVVEDITIEPARDTVRELVLDNLDHGDAVRDAL